MADSELVPLPKLEDFEAPDLPPAVKALRSISIALSQLGGNPEQAALLARQYTNVDAAREESARAAFTAALNTAQEQRARLSLAQEDERLRMAREAGQRAEERAKREEERADLAAKREERQAGIAEEQLARQRRTDFDEAVSNVVNDMSALLSGAKADVRTSDLLSAVAMMTAEGEKDPQKRVEAKAAALREAKAVQLAAAFPEAPPEETAKRIAQIIETRAERVHPADRARFLSSLQFLVPDATHVKVAEGVALTEDQWKRFATDFGDQLSAALTSEGKFEPEEAALLGQTLRVQVAAGMPAETLLDGLDVMAQQATARVIARLGVPPEENVVIAGQVAQALASVIQTGDVAGLQTIALRGVADPVKRAIAGETAELELRASALRTQLRTQPGNTALARELARIELTMKRLASPAEYEKRRRAFTAENRAREERARKLGG